MLWPVWSAESAASHSDCGWTWDRPPRRMMQTQGLMLRSQLRRHGRGVTSHTFTVRSMLADASRFPSGLNATLKTALVCPFNVSDSAPLVASHTFTVASLLADASRFPSGLNATLQTMLVCPFNVSDSAPLLASYCQTLWMRS